MYRKESYDTLSRRIKTKGDLRGDLGNSGCDSFQNCIALVTAFAQRIIMNFPHRVCLETTRKPVVYVEDRSVIQRVIREKREKSPEENRRECELLVKRL